MIRDYSSGPRIVDDEGTVSQSFEDVRVLSVDGDEDDAAVLRSGDELEADEGDGEAYFRSSRVRDDANWRT